MALTGIESFIDFSETTSTTPIRKELAELDLSLSQQISAVTAETSRSEVINVMRDIIFDVRKKVEKLENRISDEPVCAFLMLYQVSHRLESLDDRNLDSLQDKEYLHMLRKYILGLASNCRGQLSIDVIASLEKYKKLGEFVTLLRRFAVFKMIKNKINYFSTISPQSSFKFYLKIISLSVIVGAVIFLSQFVLFQIFHIGIFNLIMRFGAVLAVGVFAYGIYSRNLLKNIRLVIVEDYGIAWTDEDIERLTKKEVTKSIDESFSQLSSDFNIDFEKSCDVKYVRYFLKNQEKEMAKLIESVFPKSLNS